MVQRRARMMSRVRDLLRRREPAGPSHSSAPPAGPPSRRPARPARAPRHDAELERSQAEARYHRERLTLYRARVLSARPSSLARLRELERISAAATARLKRLRER